MPSSPCAPASDFRGCSGLRAEWAGFASPSPPPGRLLHPRRSLCTSSPREAGWEAPEQQGLGPLCSLVPELLRSLAPRALTCFFPHPLRLGRFFPSSRLARMGGARRADLAGGSVRPLKVGEVFRTATPRRGGGAEGGLRKLLFL